MIKKELTTREKILRGLEEPYRNEDRIVGGFISVLVGCSYIKN